MTDIVERLRARARDLRCLAEARFFELGENPYSEGRAEDAKNADEAADEIDRLRAERDWLREALRPMVTEAALQGWHEDCVLAAMLDNARAALGETGHE